MASTVSSATSCCSATASAASLAFVFDEIRNAARSVPSVSSSCAKADRGVDAEITAAAGRDARAAWRKSRRLAWSCVVVLLVVVVAGTPTSLVEGATGITV